MTDQDKQIAVIDAPVWTDAREQLIRDNFVPKSAPNDMIEAFLALARHRGLAPEEKHVYLIERGGKWTIQTGIDGFRLIADRTGTYAGSDPAVYTYTGDGAVESATVTVWKLVQGQRCPFGATAYVDDYTTRKLLWASMPRVMVAKVAESAALRKAFPAQLAGVYEASELDQAEANPTPSRLTGSITPAAVSQRAVTASTTSRPTRPQVLLLADLAKQLDLSAAQVRRGLLNGKASADCTAAEVEAAITTARGMVEVGDVGDDNTQAEHDNTPDDDAEYDPATGERIPDWVGKVAAGEQLAGMPTTTRGRTADQIAGME